MIPLETDIYQVLNSFPKKGHLNLKLLVLIIAKKYRILTPFYTSLRKWEAPCRQSKIFLGFVKTKKVNEIIRKSKK